ncbi:MAG TPA: TonB-dependent receptor [Xanthobacteraceae bacterium]|nr:TonB-dependent receptor [Xanthobacteraceae bacterium]
MNAAVRLPLTLRGRWPGQVRDDALDLISGRKVTVGCLMAVASISTAEAQQQPLAPVQVEAPVAKKKTTTKPTAEQIKARNAMRRAARAKQEAAANAASATPATQAPPDANPYADPSAPYKVDHLASPKFPQAIVNTPRSVTVLTKELLEDKDATSLKEVARTTAGVTIGTGEGGSAFGDRFFVRGFDVRNDVFIDGIRDPAVSIRENFFTEQIEILKGPSSTVDGRGTTGGAINIVTKQAGDKTFYNVDSQFASDATRRYTLDVNQVINPTLSFRIDGMFQNADVAERNFTTDNRGGGMAAVKWKPTDSFTLTANYIHNQMWGLPDFGVPYNNVSGAPVTVLGVPQATYYGFVNRDFQRVQQDFGTVNTEYKVNDLITWTNKIRDERSILDYVGTIPEQGTSTAPGACNSTQGGTNFKNPNPATWQVCLNPQSRYQVVTTQADQSAATFKFDTGPVQHTLVAGAEFQHEKVSIDTYAGLASEALGPGAFANGAILASALNPPAFGPFLTPTVLGTPTNLGVDTKSGYILENTNYRDTIFLTAGARFDQYDIFAKKATNEISASDGMWNYNLGAVYKPISITSLYWAYGTSSEPVGSELDGTSTTYGAVNPTATVNQIFAPQRSRAQEVGNKWELFDRHVLATAALFRTDVDNAREQRTVAGVVTITPSAAYHVQGIDLGAEGNITDKWSIYTGYVLMKTHVDHSAVPLNIGQPLAFIANQSFNVLTKYKLPYDLEIGGQATYRSQICGGTLLICNAATPTVLPDYWRFDAFLEGYVAKNYEWKVFVNNLTNKTYYDGFYQSGAPFVLQAPGRVVGGQLTGRF